MGGIKKDKTKSIEKMQDTHKIASAIKAYAKKWPDEQCLMLQTKRGKSKGYVALIHFDTIVADAVEDPKIDEEMEESK